MNATVENLGPCRRLVRIEVDTQTVENAFNEVTVGYQREVRFPGFRPGKAPRDLVSRTYAKQIEEEVRRKLVSENYRRAADEHKLRIVGSPDVEEIQFNRGQPFQFAVTVETMPEFVLPEYKGIQVRREVQTVSEEDIAKAMAMLLDQHATYLDVSRPVQSGDFVVVNYSGKVEGKPLTDFAPAARGMTEQSNFWLHITPDSFIPGFTDQLIGAQTGDRRTVTVDFPADFVTPQVAGKKGVYEVEIVQVKEKVLPALTDEIAKTYGAENVEKLREGVRRDLQNELDFKIRRVLRNQLVRSLLDRVQFELPESVLLGETKNVVFNIVRENQQRGVSKEIIDQQKDEIYQAASNSAKDRLKAAFVLRQIAEKENIEVTKEELAGRVQQIAQQNQIKLDKLIKQLKERNGISELHEQILTAKVLDFLQLHAQVEEVPVGTRPA